VDKKIVVRYPAGAGGRFIGCLIESIHNKDFKFSFDEYGGVHTFNDEKISRNVFHTHKRIVDILFDNTDPNIKLVQITVNADWDIFVLRSYWKKALRPYMLVERIDQLTKAIYGWTDTAWAKEQLLKTAWEELDIKFQQLLKKDLQSQPENTKAIHHPRILNITHGDIVFSDLTKVIETIADFIEVSDYDQKHMTSLLQQYRDIQPQLKIN
jgi:hypothetical protein